MSFKIERLPGINPFYARAIPAEAGTDSIHQKPNRFSDESRNKLLDAEEPQSQSQLLIERVTKGKEEQQLVIERVTKGKEEQGDEHMRRKPEVNVVMLDVTYDPVNTSGIARQSDVHASKALCLKRAAPAPNPSPDLLHKKEKRRLKEVKVIKGGIAAPLLLPPLSLLGLHSNMETQSQESQSADGQKIPDQDCGLAEDVRDGADDVSPKEAEHVPTLVITYHPPKTHFLPVWKSHVPAPSPFPPTKTRVPPNMETLSGVKKEFRDACVQASPAALLQILEKGTVKVDEALEHSWSGLQHACYLARPDNVKLLLEAGADPNFKRFDDMSVLMSAACSQVGEDSDGPLLCAQLVVQAGGKLEALHHKSITALIFAVKLGHARMVSYFLQHGALSLLDHKDLNSRSAVDWAAFLGKAKVVRVLLEYGANVGTRNRFGQTPAQVARAKGFHEIAALLEKVETTQWRPGKDPKLRNVLDTKRMNGTKSRATTARKAYEDQHLDMILEALELEKLAPLFEKHGIKYLDFLRLNDADLLEMGVVDDWERQALARTISETWESGFRQELRPLRLARNLTSAEAYCILLNTNSHLRFLTSSLHLVQERIEQKRSMLIVGAESTPPSQLIRYTDLLISALEQFVEDTAQLTNSCLHTGEKGGVESGSGAEAKDSSLWSNQNRVSYFLCAAVLGFTYATYKAWPRLLQLGKSFSPISSSFTQ